MTNTTATMPTYQDRPAVADIAFCVAALANGMDEAGSTPALECRRRKARR